MNAVDFAIQLGEWGEQHYRKLAEEATVPAVSTIFTMLAADQKALSGRFGATRAAKLGASPSLDRAERPLCRVFSHDPREARDNQLEAYRYAFRLELRLVNLLERLAGRESDGPVRGLLQTLAAEERRLSEEMKGLCEFARGSRWYPSAIEYAMYLDRRDEVAIN